MAQINIPVVGDILLTPHTKVLDAKGRNKFDLLLCDGSEIDEDVYPLLTAKLPLSGSLSLDTNTLIYTMSTHDTENAYVCSSNSKQDLFNPEDGTLISSNSINMSSFTQLDDSTLVGLDAGNTSVFVTCNSDFTNISSFARDSEGAYSICRVHDSTDYLIASANTGVFRYTNTGTNLGSVYNGSYRDLAKIPAGYVLTEEGGNTVTFIDKDFLFISSFEHTGSPVVTHSPDGLGYAISTFNTSPSMPTLTLTDTGSASTPNLTSPDARVPYKIVGDFNE
jgi:hypothetical protein